jgi:uncharacterized protein (TIGR02996 family)
MSDIAALARAANIELPKGKRAVDAAGEKKLLDAVAKAIDPTAARAAYAKWLAERGDAVGMLAAVGHARLEMAAREKQLLSKHADTLLGPLAAWIERGWIEPTWEHGFITAAELRFEGLMGVHGPDVLQTFVEHPSARLLRDIRITAHQTHRYERDNYQPLIDCLVDMRRPLALRELAVAGVYGSPCGDVSAVWAAFPQLEGFWAFGNALTLGEIVAPNLERMRVNLMTVEDRVLEAICAARAPKLRSLVIGGLEAKQIELLALERFPKLDTIAFDGIMKADAVVDAVLDSKIAKKLKQFSMWNCTLSKAAKARLLKQFPKALG